MRNIYKIMFFFSAALTLAAIVLLATFGLKFGVDFKGGSVMEIAFEKQAPAVDELSKTVSSVEGVSDVNVSPEGNQGALIRLNSVNESIHQKILSAISGKFGKITESRFDSIGPTVGKELKNKV